jgi:hypothetical protein
MAREQPAPHRMVKAAVVRVLRLALDIAAADPDWRGGPAEYDYFTAKQIAELIGLDRNWRTLGYRTPAPMVVFRQLRRLERSERVWTWEAGTQANAAIRHRWALAPSRPREYSARPSRGGGE